MRSKVGRLGCPVPVRSTSKVHHLKHQAVERWHGVHSELRGAACCVRPRVRRHPAAVALKPTCVNREALAAVRRYLKPRTLHVVTPTARQCSAFRSWGADIACHLQVRPFLVCFGTRDILQ